MSKRINQDGRDALERLCKDLFDDEINVSLSLRIEQENQYERMDSVLVELIQIRVQAKAVPMSMRKRLLYEQSLAS